MQIAIDIMGGDFAPEAAVKGIGGFLKNNNGIHLQLVGDEQLITPLLEKYGISGNNISVVNTTQVIAMNEHPTKALKEKTDSSIAIGFQMLASGKTDAFISAGNTGAMLVGALFSIKTLPGVLRPTISTIVPKHNGNTGLLLDVGLNADCKPEQLNQFAVMGSVYASNMLGIENPRVGLLNVGEEEGKGNLLAQAAYPLLKANTQINFIGNIEGRDVLFDKADVYVCEGFTGNIILKLAESIYEAATAQNIDHPYFHRFNFENYGGTPVLGISKPVIIGHGISGEKAFENMIVEARRMIETGLLEIMEQEMKNV